MSQVSSGPPSGESRGAALLLLLCTSTVAITSNMGMLGPLLLQLSEEFGVSLAETGLLASATALPWAIAAPVLGPLSDRFGRRRVLAASLAGLALATCAAALVNAFPLLLGVRVISGVLASAGPTSIMAAVGDHFPPNRRASALGWVNAGFGISALAGVPLLGAIGGALGWRASFLGLGLLTLILAAVIWWRLPTGASERPPQQRGLAAYGLVIRSPGFGAILAGNVLERSVYATFGLYLAAFLMQSYAMDLLEVAPLLALIAIGTIVGNIIGGRIADRRAGAEVFALGQIISAGLALAFFLVTPGIVASLLLGAAFGLATSASRPAIIAMASNASTAHRGTALGIFSFTNQLGWTLGPAVGAAGFALAGYPAIGLISGLAAAAAALVMLPLVRRSRTPRHLERPYGTTAK